MSEWIVWIGWAGTPGTPPVRRFLARRGTDWEWAEERSRATPFKPEDAQAMARKLGAQTEAK
jgi:hypothetical protein